ncbi:DUF2726 domain-containing protein [Ferrimonas balearica]|uniref:DUF2726 domain-containing protein n=1 Tax=Ferrimonas balearica TaxID=44012 RepID=UPI001C574D89|nr:DUF2726 domain-containing protein [Ferrimonas balearica]MBW3140082.1 DUF2726 domain-containing protein [Ferrimonas balearica]MBW3165104.1 DUF2726 domain-containing protein [Ferrimonas balearica]
MGMIGYLLILLILVLALLLALWWRQRRETDRGPGLSHQERTFQAALQSALDTLSLPLRPFARVKVSDVLAPGRGQQRKHWLAQYAELKDATFDFVLCDAKSLTIRAAITLDQNHKGQRTRDALIATACEATGLPLLHFPAQRHYPQEPLQAALLKTLPLPTETAQSGTPLPDSTPDPTTAPRPAIDPRVIERLSTEEFAARLSLHPRALLAMLARLGYLEWDDHGQLQLTSKGKRKGAVQWQDESEKRQFQWSVRDRHRASGQLVKT